MKTERTNKRKREETNTSLKLQPAAKKIKLEYTYDSVTDIEPSSIQENIRSGGEFDSEEALKNFLANIPASKKLVVNYLPLLQKQATKNCGYIVIAMMEFFWISAGYEVSYIPAQPFDLKDFEGESLMCLAKKININEKLCGAAKWGLLTTKDFVRVASQIKNYDCEVWQAADEERLELLIDSVLKWKIPLAIAFDVNKSGLPLTGGRGKSAHWALIVGVFYHPEAGEKCYLMTHGHNKYYYCKAKDICKSCANLEERKEGKLDLKNQIIIMTPPNFMHDAITSQLKKFGESIEKNFASVLDLNINLSSMYAHVRSSTANSLSKYAQRIKKRFLSIADDEHNGFSLSTYLDGSIDSLSFNTLERTYNLGLIDKDLYSGLKEVIKDDQTSLNFDLYPNCRFDFSRFFFQIPQATLVESQTFVPSILISPGNK